MRVPAWPFLLSVPVSSVASFAVILIGVDSIFAAIMCGVFILLSILSGILPLFAANDEAHVLLPRLPKRRTRQQKRIDTLERRLAEVQEEYGRLPEGHPNRSALGDLADVLRVAIEGEVEDQRNRRFIEVTRRADRALGSGK